MASAFQLMWFGYIFLFDLRIRGFDILPDVLGYLLITAGLRRLSHLNEHFARAARLAPIAALISLADIYEPAKIGAGVLTLTGPSFRTPIGAVLTIAGIVLIAVNLLMTHQLIAGIAQLASKQKEDDVVERTTTLWPEYMGLHIALMVILPLAALAPAIGWLAPLAQLSVGIVAYLGIMSLLKLARRTFGESTGKD
ncbi:MAG: hypothetical protein WAW16_05400 [Candidatus Cryosericum sp.]